VVKGNLFTAVKDIYTFTTRSLRARSGISGKPGVSGPNPGDSAPLNPASRFSRNLIFVEIWKIACVIYVSLSGINTLD
jgi:hypothetical protein